MFVTVREDSGVGNRTIFRHSASGSVYRPEIKCWRVYNTTLDPKYESIPCDF